MATSCGSPCYAAPELVINDENNYVGTAVDIWSCGVILFAMLCGYLPFDDDPSNPQGANINVLYKYILSTPLEIPKHASEDATDLLRLMLVPDPTKRCTLDQIRSHPWLADHKELLNKDWLIKEQKEEELQHMTLDARSVLQKDTIIPLHARIPESRDHQPSSFLQAKFISTLPSTPQTLPFNKIPTRSQSVQQHSSSSRERTNSENYRYSPPLPVHIMPSVSEQTVDPQHQQQEVTRTSRQKLMDWFNKRRPSISQSTMFNKTNRPLPDRPVSVVPVVTTTNPVRAMSIGKPLGSYAADFNDSKLRLHRGAVDQDALTSKAPNEVLLTIKESLQFMGIEMKRTHDFKLKCIRPMKRVMITNKRTRKISAVPFKLFFASSNPTIPNETNGTKKESKVMYGEQGIDNGDEVQFSVELSKIENLPGLYVVDIKRTRGNIWAFKFLYHTLLDRLDLSGHAAGGYMAHRNIQQDMIGQEQKNRISYMTTSSSGSSMMMFDESNLHK